MAGRKIYDDKFKAGAIIALQAAGYPDNKFKLQEVADYLLVPSRTLRRWYLREHGAPPDNVVTEVKKALSDRLEDLANKLVDVALRIVDDEDDESTIQQIVTSMGIVIDKKQLLDGKATERKELTGKNGGAIESKVTLLSEVSDEDLDRIIAGQPPAS